MIVPKLTNLPAYVPQLPTLPGDPKIVSEGGEATEGYRLFFSAIAQWIRSGGAVVYAVAAQRTTKATRGYVDPATVVDGALYIETDTGLVYQMRAGSWVYVLGTRLMDLTLTAATTVVAPADGSDLVVILRQDGTGGRTVTWDAGFSAASTAIDTTASTVSSFRFVRTGGLWVMVGQPTTGMTP